MGFLKPNYTWFSMKETIFNWNFEPSHSGETEIRKLRGDQLLKEFWAFEISSRRGFKDFKQRRIFSLISFHKY